MHTLLDLLATDSDGDVLDAAVGLAPGAPPTLLVDYLPGP